MSDTSTSAQNSSGAAGLAKHERHFLALTAGGIVFALVMAVLVLRLHRLSELPPGISFDEGTNGVDALRVLQGEHAVFYPETGGGRETLGFYAIALSTFFLGRTPLAIHLPSALVSLSTVLSFSGWGGCSLGATRVVEPPRGAASWLEAPGPVCWRFLLARRSLGALRSEEIFCSCFSVCLWPCSGGGGRGLSSNGLAMVERGGALHWQARALG